MSLSLIVAMTEERVIGRDNQLPWHITEDLQRFKKITMGHPIIMGRKTFDSIGKPLPGRQNIVVTRDPSRRIEGVTVAGSLDAAIKASEKSDEIFVIGGAALFELAMPLSNRLYITLIHQKILGDVYFPKFDLKRDFEIIEETHHQSTSGEHLSFSFITAVSHR